MPPTARIESTNGTMVGAAVTDGSVQRIALFSADGTPQSSVTYSANPAAGQTGVHVITDLIANTPYFIARNGVNMGTVPASSQGVVTFQSTEGGVFTIWNQFAAPKPPTNLRIIRVATSAAPVR
jgi:hypothetical protein